MFISEADDSRLCLYQLLLDPEPALQPLARILSHPPGPASVLVHATAVWAPDDSAVLVRYYNENREAEQEEEGEENEPSIVPEVSTSQSRPARSQATAIRQ